MIIIRQGSLFDLQDLYELEPTHRFDAVFQAINLLYQKKLIMERLFSLTMPP